MKRILIVDDIEENIYLLRVLLEGHGYEVVPAVNGREALAKALEQVPDMIISDILMPVMDGYTLCREWKADDRLKHIPFIFYTATYTDPRDEQLALDMGADAFIIKPTEPDEFLIQVEKILTHDKKKQPAPAQEPMAGDETILKNYNETLIRKLEQKMLELEKLNKELEAEIAEKNKIESSLRESEELFRNMFHQHAAVKLIIDSDTGNIIDANEAALNFYGWSRSQLLSMCIQDINILPAVDVKTAMEMVKTRKRYRFEFRHRIAGGVVRDVEVFSSKIKVKGKELLHSVIHDITDRKQAETRLVESERKHRIVADNTYDWEFWLDTQENFIYCSPSCVRITGHKTSEFINDPGLLESIIHPDDLMYYSEHKKKALKSKDPMEINFRIIKPDGTEHWIGHVCQQVIDENGISMGRRGSNRDITERKHAEDTIRENEKKLREAQKMAHLGYWSWDVKTGDVEWSDEVYRIFRLDPEKFTPHIDSIMALSPWPEDSKRDKELISRAIEIHEPGSYEQKFLRPDNSIGYYYSFFQGNYDESGILISITGTVMDITERKLAEEALRNSEERFRRLHESMIDAFVQIDMDGNIISFNKAYLEMLGYSAEEITRLTYKELTPEKWHAFEMDIVNNQILPKGFSDIYEKEYRRKDGTVFPVEIRTSLLKDANCKPMGMWAIVRDITKRKQDQNELILRSTAINNAANAIIITDNDGVILYANPAFDNLTGFATGEALGKNSRELLKSEYHDRFFYKSLWSKITSGNLWTGEITNKRKDGSIYTEEMTIAPVKDAAGNIQNYVAIIQDITEKKFATDLLKTRLNLISFSADHTLDELITRTLDEVEKFTASSISFIHFLDEDQKTLTLQAWSTRTSLEYCRAEGKGLHYDIEKAGVWVDCVRERKAVVHNDYMSLPHRKGLPEGHAPLIRELVISIMRNNSIRAILGIGNKTMDYNDRDISVTTYIADILWDVIERKRGEEFLKQLNAELETRVVQRTADLEKANKELESFSYSVSHDLRAPLRHIGGFLEMLKRETKNTATEMTEHYIEVISDSAKRMGMLIDDLLSFSRMRRTSLSRQIVNMEELVSNVLNEFFGEINTHKINISRKELPQVQGDTAMLRVVLVNLISNAIKFSAKSHHPVIEIGSDQINGEKVFYIRDNGAGFDMKYSDKLFGVFQRLHNERDFEGTGIGLAMVKNIIERHNGRVRAEGEPGKGACFYFYLPDTESSEKPL